MPTIMLRNMHTGDRIALAPGPRTVGRAGTAHVFVDDERASRYHCELFVEDDGRVRVADLGSKNGTFVGARPVVAVQDLEPGGVLQVGRTLFVLEADFRSDGVNEDAIATLRWAS